MSLSILKNFFTAPADWAIHRVNVQTVLFQTAPLQRPPPNQCPGYDTKQSDCEVPVMLGLLGMQSTPSLPSLPDSLWPRIVAPDRALAMG